MEQTTCTNREESASNRPGLVRDDRAGTLAAGLAGAIDAAHQLLLGAEALTDDIGFEAWREWFSAWRTCCGEMLRRCFEREAAAEFYGGTQIPDMTEERWREGRRAAVKAVEDMIELLATLRQTLAGRGAAHTDAQMNRAAEGRSQGLGIPSGGLEHVRKR